MLWFNLESIGFRLNVEELAMGEKVKERDVGNQYSELSLRCPLQPHATTLTISPPVKRAQKKCVGHETCDVQYACYSETNEKTDY